MVKAPELSDHLISAAAYRKLQAQAVASLYAVQSAYILQIIRLTMSRFGRGIQAI
jgi:hypothetical protein